YGIDVTATGHVVDLYDEAVLARSRSVDVDGYRNPVSTSTYASMVHPFYNLAVNQQKFFFSFLEEALRQYNMTFLRRIGVGLGGARVVLAGGVLSLVNAKNADSSYVPVVTALAGVLVSTTAGAFLVHSNGVRDHLTKEIDVLQRSSQKDHAASREQR